jgi:taurine dioxygenase
MSIVLDQPATQQRPVLRVRCYKPLVGAVVENGDLGEDNRQTLQSGAGRSRPDFFRRLTLATEQDIALARIFGNAIRKNVYLPAVSGFPETEIIAHGGGKARLGGTENWLVDV